MPLCLQPLGWNLLIPLRPQSRTGNIVNLSDTYVCCHRGLLLPHSLLNPPPEMHTFHHYLLPFSYLSTNLQVWSFTYLRVFLSTRFCFHLEWPGCLCWEFPDLSSVIDTHPHHISLPRSHVDRLHPLNMKIQHSSLHPWLPFVLLHLMLQSGLISSHDVDHGPVNP